MLSSITVPVAGVAVGDGQAQPPVVGERRDYFLTFHEVRTIFIDSGLYDDARWIEAVEADTRKLEHTRSTWRTTLRGDGWSAIWHADRHVDGTVRLYGYLAAATSFDSDRGGGGIVTAIRGNWADLAVDASSPT